MRKSKNKLTLATSIIVIFFGLGMAVSDWKVSTVQPIYIGTEVVRGGYLNRESPDESWTVPNNGLLQAVYHDHDPKCNKEAGFIRFRKDGEIIDNYPVPTAPPKPGKDCADTIDNLWVSRVFALEKDIIVEADMGQTSSYFYFDFATYTPEATYTVTTEPSSTPTATITDTPTINDTPTEIATLVTTVTFTPVATATATATATVSPPEPLVACLHAYTEPPWPQTIESEGFVADIYVESVNPQNYILDTGDGFLFFDEQPIRNYTFYPNHTYHIFVSLESTPCLLGATPTNLAREDQPTSQILNLPWIKQGK